MSNFLDRLSEYLKPKQPSQPVEKLLVAVLVRWDDPMGSYAAGVLEDLNNPAVLLRHRVDLVGKKVHLARVLAKNSKVEDRDNGTDLVNVKQITLPATAPTSDMWECTARLLQDAKSYSIKRNAKVILVLVTDFRPFPENPEALARVQALVREIPVETFVVAPSSLKLGWYNEQILREINAQLRVRTPQATSERGNTPPPVLPDMPVIVDSDGIPPIRKVEDANDSDPMGTQSFGME